MAEVFISGGAGFIGYHLARSLAKEGNNVTLVDNLFRGRKDREFDKLCSQSNVSFFSADLTSPASLSEFKRDYDYVYHLAAINGTSHFYEIPETVMRVNLLTLVHVLDWFRQHGHGRFLFSSSSEVYAGTAKAFGVSFPTPENIPLTIENIYNPRVSYAVSKMAGEVLVINYARAYGFPASIVRYHNIYGPRMGFEHVIPQFLVRLVKKENPFRIYGAEQKRAFCYVGDAVEATRRVIQVADSQKPPVVHIGNPEEEITMLDLAKRLLRVAGVNPQIEVCEAPLGSVARRTPDIGMLVKLTGFRPRVALDKGLPQTFAWYKKAIA